MATRLYLGNLGMYNEGKIIGKWIDLPITDEQLESVYVEILVGHFDDNGEYCAGYEYNGCLYEEVMIMDWESDIIDGISPYDDVLSLSDLIREYEDLDEHDQKAVGAYCECINDDLGEAINALYRITFYDGWTFEDMAREDILSRVSSVCNVAFFESYFDYDAYAEGLKDDGYYETSEGIFILE